MSADRPEIRVSRSASELHLGVCGRATQRIFPTAARVVEEFLESAPPEARIVLDLDGCGWVDSTFAGWMAGLQKRLDRTQVKLVLSHCSEKCLTSLSRMHLSGLFEYADVPPPAEFQKLEVPTKDRPDLEALKLMLKAHEDLCSVNQENVAAFEPVVGLLRRQIEQSK